MKFDKVDDSPLNNLNVICGYHEPHELVINLKLSSESHLSYFHLNCRGLLSHNWENFVALTQEMHNETFAFDHIGISEAFRCDMDSRLTLLGYHPLITRCRQNERGGGVGVFIKCDIQYTIRDDLSIFLPHVFEAVFVETTSSGVRNSIVGVIYIPNTAPRADMDLFATTVFEVMEIINIEHKIGVIMGDMNIDLLKCSKHGKTNEYMNQIISLGYLPVVTKPTRVCASTATLIDHIYINNLTSSLSPAIVITDAADHFGTCLFMANKTKHTDSTKSTYRIFSERNVAIFNGLLSNIDFSSVMSEHETNTAHNTFLALFTEAFNTAFPIKTGTKK